MNPRLQRNPHTLRCSTPAALVALCALLPASSDAEQWRYPIEAAAESRRQPLAISAVPTADGFEVRGGGRVLRFNAAGEALGSVDDVAEIPGRFGLFEQGPAGAVEIVHGNSRDWPRADLGCTRHVRADGVATRRLLRPDPGPQIGTPPPEPDPPLPVGSQFESTTFDFNLQLAADADGGLYSRSRDGAGSIALSRFGLDCSPQEIVPAPAALDIHAFQPAADDASVYVLSSNSLIRVDADSIRFETALPGPDEPGTKRMLAPAAGDTLLALRLQPGATALVSRHGSDTTLEWQTVLPGTGVPVHLQEVDGQVLVVLRTRTASGVNDRDQIYVLDAQGQLVAEQQIADALILIGMLRQPSASGVSVPWVLGPPQAAFSFYPPAATRLVLPRTDGQLELLAEVPAGYVPEAQTSDGSILLLGTVEPRDLLVLRGDDSSQHIPINELASLVQAPHVRQLLADGRGAVARVYRDDAGSDDSESLHAIGLDGELLWRADVPLFGSFGMQSHLAGERVCTHAGNGLRTRWECRARSSGELLFAPVEIDNPDDTLAEGLRSSLDAQGDAALYLLSSDCQPGACLYVIYQARISADGQASPFELIGAEPFYQRPSLTAPGADGSVWLQDLVDGFKRLRRFDGSGELRATTDLGSADPIARELHPIAVAADGSLLALRNVFGGTPRPLRSYAADGQLLWERSADELPGFPLQAIDADGDWLLRSRETPDSITLARISGADGTLLWKKRVFANGTSLIRDQDGTRVGLGDGRLLRWFDARDGRALAAQTTSATPHATLAADGRVYTLEPASRANPPALELVATTAPTLADAPAPALLQAALIGSWYDPLVSGTGLLLDALPSGVLFGAMFSYRRDGGTAADGQRWYTVQGGVGAGDQHAELTLVRNVGGAFGAPGGVQSTAAGHARLRLLDCDRLLFEYAFDDSGEHARLTSARVLQRVVPRASACIDGHGEVQPSAWPTQDDGGFRRASSGAWYQPITSGQGVLLELLPPTADTNGLLAAAWFTYRPDASGSDDSDQRWFTLFGPLTASDSGAATLTIMRTLGGKLDATPTSNTHRVGEATLSFETCDRATLDYRFDDSEWAGEFAGRSGSIALLRGEGCG